MFILQQKQQLDQYRVLLSQQLLSLQQSPLEDLALYQQQLLQLRQQEYQASEALKQLELQHQQINFKMLQYYNTQKVIAASQPQAPPITGVSANQLPATIPSVTVNQATPNTTITPQLTQAPPTSSSLSVDTRSRESSIDPTKHSPLHEIFFDSKSPSPIGTKTQDSTRTSLDSIVSSFSKRRGGSHEEEIMDDEMEHLLVKSSQSDFFAEIKPSAVSSVMGDGGEDSELVDQYYCQVCGVSFKSEGSETNLEENNASLASLFFHNANFENHDDHVRSKAHLDNYIAHSQFMKFKQEVYSEPRKQLDTQLDNTAQINSANYERFVFAVRSKLRDFDEEIEDYKDSYKWRNAHSRTVAFVDEIIAMNRQLLKMKSIESIQNPALQPPSGLPQQNLADLVFVDEEDEFGYDDLVDTRPRGSHATDFKKRKKSTHKK